MSTIKIPYSKFYLFQKLLENLFYSFLILNLVWWSSFSLILFFVSALVLLGLIGYFQRNFIALWSGEKAALLISKEGFIEYIHSYQVGVVSWETLKEVKINNLFFVKKKICLKLHNPKQFLKKEKRIWKRWNMRRDILFHQTPYYWDSGTIGMSIQDFLRLIEDASAGRYDFNNIEQHLIEQ